MSSFQVCLRFFIQVFIYPSATYMMLASPFHKHIRWCESKLAIKDDKMKTNISVPLFFFFFFHFKKDFAEDMPRLLRALSDYRKIKELHIEERDHYGSKWRFALPFMESMLSLLISGSTSPAVFSSSQILNIRIGILEDDEPGSEYTPGFPKPFTDYIPEYIKPLLLRIKSVRTPNNLKSVVLNSKRI